MLGWRYSYVATSNDPTLVVSFKPCQSAQTRELASMRTASGNDSLDIKESTRAFHSSNLATLFYCLFLLITNLLRWLIYLIDLVVDNRFPPTQLTVCFETIPPIVQSYITCLPSCSPDDIAPGAIVISFKYAVRTNRNNQRNCSKLSKHVICKTLLV